MGDINMDIDMDMMMGGDSGPMPGDDLANLAQSGSLHVVSVSRHDSRPPKDRSRHSHQSRHDPARDGYGSHQRSNSIDDDNDEDIDEEAEFGGESGADTDGNHDNDGLSSLPGGVRLPTSHASIIRKAGAENRSATPQQQQPGAFTVPTRAIGSRPAWHRRMSAHLAAPFQANRGGGAGGGGRNRRRSMTRNDSRSNNNHIPPEMRMLEASTYVNPPSSIRVSNQSQIPPELRRVSTSGSGAAGRRRSSFFDMFGLHSADLVAAECEVVPPRNSGSGDLDDDDDEFIGDVRKGVAIITCGALILAALCLGVIFALKGRNGDSSGPKTGDETMAPGAAPTSISERFDQLSPLLAGLSSAGMQVFSETTSPQYKAVQWLAEVDEAQLDESNQVRLEHRYALATFYYALTGDGWTDTCQFLSGGHECEWTCIEEGEGVICDDDDQITSIVFSVANNLKGYIPEELKGLSKSSSSFQSIKISQQYVFRSATSSIPGLIHTSNLGYVTSLTSLDISSNALHSSIPSTFGMLTSLEELILSRNEFTGNIPSVLRNLQPLRRFYADYNELNGHVLNGLSELANIEEFVVDGNRNMVISENNAFFRMTKLRKLSLADINWNGFLKGENLAALSNLEILNLQDTSQGGSLPTQLGLLTKLHTINLSGNSYDGEFPWMSFADDNVIERINIGLSTLEGNLTAFPSYKFTNLLSLVLSANKFGGSIPDSFGTDMTNLKRFVVDRNFVSGTLPSSMSSMTSLEEVDLSSNNILFGTVPESFQSLTNLDHFNVRNTAISGSLDFLCEDNDDITVVISKDKGIDCSCCFEK